MPAKREGQDLSRLYGRERRSGVYEWHRRLQTRLGNAILLWMARRYQRLPERAGYRLGSAIGTAMRWLSPRHHRIVMTNLRLAFGEEKSEGELRAIAHGCYRHLGKCLTEFIRLPGMTPEEVRRVTDLKGAEHIEAALARGNGAIILTAHLGNWELTGARLAVEGYPLTVIARPQRDTALTDYILRTREAAGMRVLHRDFSVRRSLKALRSNQVVGILLDQNAGDDGIFVDFFGHPASTAPGAAAFALRTDAVVLPTHSWRNPDNRLSIVIEEPAPLIRTGDRDHDLLANTAQYTKMIESHIRAHPEQWFWLHKRWKSRPPATRGT